MKGQRVPVKTQLGLIKGRDSIFLDKLVQTDCPSTVKVHGEISANLCTDYSGPPGKWISYEMTFKGVLAYRGWEIDLYPSELQIVSSLDIIQGSTWAEDLAGSTRTHYVLSTYDYIYEILAQDFKLELGDARKANRDSLIGVLGFNNGRSGR